MKIKKSDILYVCELTGKQKRILEYNTKAECINTITVTLKDRHSTAELEKVIEELIEKIPAMRATIQSEGMAKPLQVYLKSMERSYIAEKPEEENYEISHDKLSWIFIWDEVSRQFSFKYSMLLFDVYRAEKILNLFEKILYSRKHFNCSNDEVLLIEKYHKMRAKAIKSATDFKISTEDAADFVCETKRTLSVQSTNWMQIENIPEITDKTCFLVSWAMILQSVNYSNQSLFGMVMNSSKESEQLIGNFSNTYFMSLTCTETTTVQEAMDMLSGNNEIAILDLNDFSLGVKRLKYGIEIVENQIPFADNAITCKKDSEYASLLESGCEVLIQIAVNCGCKFRFLYNENTISKKRLQIVSELFERVLRQILKEPGLEIKNVVLSQQDDEASPNGDEEKAELLNLLGDRFSVFGDEPALLEQNSFCTYSEVNQKINKMSNYLLKTIYKEEKNPVVAILMNRSSELLITILAILKSGGAYLPIDPMYPEDRKKYILEDARPICIITNVECQEYEMPVFTYRELEQAYVYENEKAEVMAEPSSPAYILYTSGSTGKPKGVVVSHKAIYNRLDWIIRYCNITKTDTILFKTPYTFDVSLIEILAWRICGCRLCVLDPEAHKNPQKIMDAVQKYNVTILHFVPSMLNAFTYYFKESPIQVFGAVRYLFTSGEALEEEHIQNLKETFPASVSQMHVLNLYGPTEAAVDVSYYPCDWNEKNPIPIGKPIQNVKLYCLDTFHRILPAGMDGELAIAGVALADGYLNNPEMTEKKFILHPVKKERMYLTGDRALIREDGQIIFNGRLDHQVKIRGLRVELGEIREVILSYPNVLASEVVCRGKEEHMPYLAAFVVWKMPEDSFESLKSFTEKKLADYMVPAKFISLKALPLTSNGKTDIGALLNMEIEENVEDIQEWSENENEIARLWENVLGRKIPSKDSDFFAFGGDSIKAIYLLTQLNAAFSCDWSIEDIFRYPTLRQQKEALEGAIKNRYTNNQLGKEAIRKEVSKHYSVNATQKRLYYLEGTSNSTAYNIVGVYQILSGKLNINKMNEAFGELLRKYPVLRTSYKIEGLQVMATVEDNCDCNIQEVKLEQSSKPLQERLESIVKPFDLEKAPLIELLAIHDNENEYFMINISHIIADGISLSILMREFQQIYIGCQSEQEEVIPYYEMKTDYTQNRQYWENELKEIPDSIVLKEDYKRPEMFSYKGNSIVNHYIRQQVKKCAEIYKTTESVIMLSSFAVLIKKSTTLESFMIGLVVSGRNSLASQNVVGPMVNTVPLLIKIDNSWNSEQVIKYIHKKVMEAVKHQEYPIDEMIEERKIERLLDRNALFNIMYTYQADFYKPFELSDVVLKDIHYKTQAAKVDFSLFVYENTSEVEFEYCTDLFSENRMEKMSRRFQKVLEYMYNPNHAGHAISKCDLFLEEESSLYQNRKDSLAYIKQGTIQEQFCKIARKYPERDALHYSGGNSLTYAKLNRLSDEAAVRLEKIGLKPNDIIGIRLGNTPELIILILAILKSGAAYVPIDLNTPEQRIKYIMEDSNAKWLMVKENDDKVSNITCVLIDTIVKLEIESDMEWNYCGSINDLCYIIYTSGSTGKPKGCKLKQRGVSDYLNWAIDYYFSDFEGSRIYFPFFTSLSVDLTVTSLFTPLLSGNTMVIYPNSIDSLFQIFSDGYSNVVKLTPSHMKLLAGFDFSHSAIHKMIVGGEQLTKTVCDLIKIPDVRIFNEYGPTEATVGCMIYEYNRKEQSEAVPIGAPIEHMNIYLLDKEQNLCLPGVTGEIYISGSGIADGYTDEKATKACFLESPFDENETLYRTGDYAYYNYEETIIYTGRMDTQKKIRGHRIELEEVEACILQNPDIKSVYTYIEKEQLIACIIGSKDKIDVKKVRAYLRKWLAPQMVPDAIIVFSEFPYLLSGKADGKKIREQVQEKRKEAVAVQEEEESETEQKIREIWSSVISHNNFTIDDNFFEVGGNSLLLVKIHEKMTDLKPGIQIMDYFKYSTIRQLAEYIDSENNDEIDCNVFTEIYCKSMNAETEIEENVMTLSDKEKEVIEALCANYKVSHVVLISGLLFTILSDIEESGRIQMMIQEEEKQKNYVWSRNQDIEAVFSYITNEDNASGFELANPQLSVCIGTNAINREMYDLYALYMENEIVFCYNAAKVQPELALLLSDTLGNILNML